MSENLLLEAQPPRMMPYTPMEETARMKSTPMFTSVMKRCGEGPKGITEKTTSAGTMIRQGPRRNTSFSPKLGVRSSFTKSFRASAMGCSHPLGPTRLGPKRICM